MDIFRWVAVLALLCPSSSMAVGPNRPPCQTTAVWRFDIPSQIAADGIAAFSRQAVTIQVLVSQTALSGRRTRQVKGTYCIEQALTILLAGSGLRWLRTGQNTYSIVIMAAARMTRPNRHLSNRPYAGCA